jgi:hypothetical protein
MKNSQGAIPITVFFSKGLNSSPRIFAAKHFAIFLGNILELSHIDKLSDTPLFDLCNLRFRSDIKTGASFPRVALIVSTACLNILLELESMSPNVEENTSPQNESENRKQQSLLACESCRRLAYSKNTGRI